MKKEQVMMRGKRERLRPIVVVVLQCLPRGW
jgi:hypothetical protein